MLSYVRPPHAPEVPPHVRPPRDRGRQYRFSHPRGARDDHGRVPRAHPAEQPRRHSFLERKQKQKKCRKDGGERKKNRDKRNGIRTARAKWVHTTQDMHTQTTQRHTHKKNTHLHGDSRHMVRRKLRAEHRGRREVPSGGQQRGRVGLEHSSPAGVGVHPRVEHVVRPPQQRRRVLKWPDGGILLLLLSLLRPAGLR